MLSYSGRTNKYTVHIQTLHIFDNTTLPWRFNGRDGSQITGVLTDYSTVCSDADHRKHQSSASLAFVCGIHRWPVNSPHKGTVTRKMSLHLMTPSWGVLIRCCSKDVDKGFQLNLVLDRTMVWNRSAVGASDTPVLQGHKPWKYCLLLLTFLNNTLLMIFNTFIKS